MPITVVARAKAKPEMENQAKEELSKLLMPTRAENGCIEYNLHQSPEDPTEFLFYENWRSQEDLDRHLKTPHIQTALAKVPAILTGPVEIKIWKKVE